MNGVNGVQTGVQAPPTHPPMLPSEEVLGVLGREPCGQGEERYGAL